MTDALLGDTRGGPALWGLCSTAAGLLEVWPPGSSLPVLCALPPTCRHGRRRQQPGQYDHWQNCTGEWRASVCTH